MKELSIEEKAKRYDEAIERAKEWFNPEEPDSYTCIVESIFPELKESDERIRKELIVFLKENLETGRVDETWSSSVLERWITWLEKQGEKRDICKTCGFRTLSGEQKPTNKVKPKFKVGDWIISNSDIQFNIIAEITSIRNSLYYIRNIYGNEGYETWDSLRDNYHVWTIQDAKPGDVLIGSGNVKYSNGIKYERIYLFNNFDNAYFTLTKFSNHAEEYDIDVSVDYPDNTVPATKEQKEILFMVMKDAGYVFDFEKKELKKIEQKVAEKAEPKFNVGEWIVWQDKCYKVNYNGCGYELVDQNGLSTSLEYGTIDENAHLWDISKDAKDGDVLVMQKTNVTYESIFIFKKIENNRIIQYLHYFTTDADEEVCEVRSIDGFLEFVGTNTHPATKEQRDLLFKKIHNAGYEWDAEKKELNNIEQATDKTKPKFKEGDTIQPKDRGHEPWQIMQVDILNKKYIFKDGYVIPFLHEDNYELVEQTPTWSEDDERMYRGLHNLIYSTPYCDSRKELSDWLKTIKDRVQWSKEDEKCIRLTIDIIDSALRAGFCVQLDRDRCVDWLKSLRPQTIWKPTEEQMEALEHFIVYHNGSTNYAKDLEELRLQLKKLREE